MASMTIAGSRPKLKEVCGLEVPHGLIYQGWEPGGTYTKSLILKNIKLRTQKIKFRISSKNFFCDVYPHPVVLSAGNSCTVPVTFRPVEKAECLDNVEISTSEGNFTVPLQAVLPKPKLVLPSSVQLGICEVQSSVKVSFAVTNTGSVSTNFNWECGFPFEVHPSRGILPPKGSCKLEAIFIPTVASVYKVTAACHYGDQFGSTETIKLEGIGKYPHLLVKEANNDISNGDLFLSFGGVSLCMPVEKSIELINSLPVPATFTIVPESSAQTLDLVFSCSRTQGTVPPLGKLTIKVVCNPTYIGQCGLDRFELIVRGSLAKTKITCKAELIGPKVIVDKTCINFGSIGCGTTSFAYLCLTNDTKTPTVYQFQNDSNGVFQIDSPSGELKGGASHTIKIVFNPRKPIPYHKRVKCLVLNQDPITVHFIGSAYSETVKPAQLSQHHVSLYNAIVHTGLSKLPPQYLLQSIENGSLTVTSDGSLIPDKIFHPPLDKLAPSTVDINVMSNYFEQGGDIYDSQHLEVDADDLQFGFISPNKSSEGKILTVTNLTQGTVICSWMTGQDDVFQVVPSDRELSPQSTGAFAISFWPREHNNLFCRELECYVFYKALSDYSKVDRRVILPPWCLTVTATGHSFSSTVEPFQPVVSFSCTKLVLPSTLPNRASYRSFVVKNLSDNPVVFSFEQDRDLVFHVKPDYGMVMGRSWNVFVAEMLPRAPQLNNHSLDCTLNGFSKFTKTLELSGVAESPKLLLDKEEKMFFMPTCVGGSSETSVAITNPCGLPVRFAWQIKGPTSNCLKIFPRAGILEPNQHLPVTFTFVPHEVKHYHFTTVVTALLTESDSEGATYKHRVPLCIHGKGTTGKIKCLNSPLDSGHIVIGTSSKVSLSLRNGSSCKLKFKVGARQIIETPDGQTEEVMPNGRPHGLEFGMSECEIEAFTNLSLPMTLRPSQTAKYVSTIFYQLILPHGGGVDSTHHDLCSVTVHGAYPRLSVTDVKGNGVACSLSKSQIWKMLQIQKINHHLCEDPSPSELRYTISTRHSTTRKAPVFTRAVLDFNFCPGPLSDKTHSTYYLLLSNSGQVEAEWAFKFPMDMYMEPEFWAETGEIDPKEQHEIDVVRNSLFSIEPKSGTLGPGDEITVRCSYQHSNLGISNLPVLLKINRGREIMLNFTGVTSPLHSPCITLTSHTHTFVPMPLDSTSYPTQVFPIYNAGDVTGSYTIDVTPLEEIKKLNYNTSIIKCLHPQGSLPPGQTTDVEFLFSPAEPKLYMVDLPIHFTDGSIEVVTFRGEGLLAGRDSLESEKEIDGMPLLTTISQLGQLAELSQAKISLNDIPIFAIVRCIVFIRNISDCTISYKWKTETNQVVSIHPSSGYLQPGRSAQLRLAFHSQTKPSVYDMDIPCFVTNESEMTLYQRKLAEWEKLEEEKKHEFTITDKKVFVRKQNLADDTETYEDWMKKDLSKKSKTRTRRRKDQSPKAPIPPEPEILHLSITGRTYSIPDYCKQHSDFDSFMIDYNSIITKTKPVERENINGKVKIKVSKAEMSVLETTLAQFLRDLENDSNFRNSLTVISNEKVPYFSQLTNNRPGITVTDNDDDISKETASRHVYAFGLEQVPSVVEYTEQEGSSSQVVLLHRTEDGEGEGEGSELSIGLPDLPLPITAMEERDVVGRKIKCSTEFQSFTELVAENVLLNIIKEVNTGELNLTAPVYTITKPPL